MDRRTRLVQIFTDTMEYCRTNAALADAMRRSMACAQLYAADAYPTIGDRPEAAGVVTVSMRKTFEAAVRLKAQHPDAKIAVLNFASAVSPGGGVRYGSSAQEESLCRCSTLYPTLDQQRFWDGYYSPNLELCDALHTDACIYSPDVVICKTDDDYPVRLAEKDFVTVDVISCAAPDLSSSPGNIYNPEEAEAVTVTPQALYALHLRRAKHILHICAANEADVLVLGAFGCGAFRNDPGIVSQAFSDALNAYARYFRQIEFAVYCRGWETENYELFSDMFRERTQ